MRISHVIPSIDISTGGPARSSTNLIKSLVKLNKKIQLYLITIKSKNPILLEFINSRSNLIFSEKGFFKLFTNFKKSLILNDVDIYHAHSLWKLEIHIMCKVAKTNKTPYVISTRGMLESWSLSQSFIMKKIAMFLYQHNDLNKAACVHATADSEANNIRSLGFTNPIAIIPNGINLVEYPKYTKLKKNKRKVLFLSRIHKKKGIENLINAWKKIDPLITKNWHVEIIGDGNKRYINSLLKLISKLNLESQIKITKPLYGKSKVKKFQDSDLFVLPTYSENFGIVVAEALASCVPVITTKGAPWEDLNSYKCGDWIEIGEKKLIKSLSKMLLKSEAELWQMGLRGRKLVEDKYSMKAVARDFNKLYEWILGISDKPNFIQ